MEIILIRHDAYFDKNINTEENKQRKKFVG